MSLPVVVSPTTPNPTHHLKLSDGVNEVGLILRSGNRVDPRAIERRPRQNGQYSPFTQSDWGSGRGIQDANSDRSRFSDSKRLITRHNGTVLIAGQETYATGYKQADAYLPGNVTWTALLTTNQYIAYKFAASASGNRAALYLWLRRRGTPTSTLTVELCSDSAGNPGTVLKTATATTNDLTDTISELYQFTFASVQAVTAATNYWIKVYASGTDTAANCWQVGCDAADTNNLTKASSNGSSWSAAAYDLYFRLVDDTDFLGGIFFTYKQQLYFVDRPTGAAAPKLYINGDRGVATGTHSTTTLQDTTKTWTTNIFAGSTLLIIDGTNSEWQTAYRTIASNTANTLTFSPAFPKAPVSANTLYVILGSNVWTELTGHGLTALPTAAVVAGDIVYFAQGDALKMRKMCEYLSGTTWTRAFAEENNYATFLGTFRHPTLGQMVFKVNNKGNTGLPAYGQARPDGSNWLRRLRFAQLIDNCEATTGWTFAANVTGSVDNTRFISIKAVKAAGSPTTTPFMYRAFTQYSIDAYKHTAVRFWIYASVNVADGDLKIRLSQATDCSTTIQDVNLPAFAGNEWVQMTLPYTDTAASLKYMTSFGWITALNATFYIDGLELVPAGAEVSLGNPGEKITGVNVYGDPEVPWVFREQSAGSVEGGTFNPIPLRELSNAQSIYNGAGSVVHNVNLYFSFLFGLERFYRNNLDDVGPNRDEGLPSGRRGYITAMQGYIGRFFYNIDAGNGGRSAILESTSGTDHHETYRCDTVGKRIRNLYLQVIPGTAADRLWFTEGNDVAWLPLPGNTLKENTDSTFRFTHEGVLETGWITGAEAEAVKIFHSLRLFTENLTASRKIEWDYRKDEETAWTTNATAFTSGSVQEVTLDVSAKRLKLRFRLQTNTKLTSPLIKGLVISATTRPETRWTYSLSTFFEDRPINLRGDQDTTLTAAAVLTQLDTWMEANTILTMSSVFEPFNGKSVILEPVVTRPLSLIADESLEKLTGSLTLLEP